MGIERSIDKKQRETGKEVSQVRFYSYITNVLGVFTIELSCIGL